MNRIARLTIALSVFICTISCIEMVDTDVLDTKDYITVTSQVGALTKAGYDEMNLPGSFYMEISNPEFSGTMTKSGSTSNYNFPNNQKPFWTTSDVSAVFVKAITEPRCYELSTGIMTVETDQTDSENIQASDLLGATTGNGIDIRDNNINVSFSHLMSKLQVRYTKAGSFEINSIKFENAAISGKFSYETMNYDYSVTPTIGDITMNHNSAEQVAEGIFFPYTPQTGKQTAVVINVTINDTPKDLRCEFSLKSAANFVGGRCYVMKITIDGSSIDSAGVVVEGWDKDQSSTISGERVLWIGEANAAGDPANGFSSYPEMVGEALNCTIVNNSVPGLSAINHLSKTADVMGSLSYESLIIPYIDGTLDKCTTIVFDLGFEDRAQIISEANGLCEIQQDPYTAILGADGYYTITFLPVRGYTYLMRMANGTKDYEEYRSDLNSHQFLKGSEDYYLIAMSKIISHIRTNYPNIRIIIGNYFVLESPFIAFNYAWTLTGTTEQIVDLGSRWGDYAQLGRLLCYYNEALAGLWDLQVVNVQNYLWMSDDEYWNLDGILQGQADFTKFCPDGLHPYYNRESTQAIADVYIRELDGVIGSR